MHKNRGRRRGRSLRSLPRGCHWLTARSGKTSTCSFHASHRRPPTVSAAEVQLDSRERTPNTRHDGTLCCFDFCCFLPCHEADDGSTGQLALPDPGSLVLCPVIALSLRAALSWPVLLHGPIHIRRGIGSVGRVCLPHTFPSSLLSPAFRCSIPETCQLVSIFPEPQIPQPNHPSPHTLFATPPMPPVEIKQSPGPASGATHPESDGDQYYSHDDDDSAAENGGPPRKRQRRPMSVS